MNLTKENSNLIEDTKRFIALRQNYGEVTRIPRMANAKILGRYRAR